MFVKEFLPVEFEDTLCNSGPTKPVMSKHNFHQFLMKSFYNSFDGFLFWILNRKDIIEVDTICFDSKKKSQKNDRSDIIYVMG